ncbi:MAG: hypothetical protein K0R98_1351, partial [Rickettsiaceae bacterium]|nr:hypothetical protein [Rickettsiaceae bacterium]
MAGISLGSFNTSTDGKTSGLGFLSGLDSTSIIEGILSGQKASIQTVTDNITANKTKITEVGNLKTLLDRLRTTVDFLRSPPGVGNENNDFFKHTTSSLSSNTVIAASTYLSVSTQAGASLNSYAIADISRAVAHQIRRDGFTSQTASVVGNLSVTDNYQARLGTVSGSVLNATTPITFANDTQGSRASVDITFGTQNQFGATDTVTIGSTTITFGGGGGNDIDISVAATVTEKVEAIAAHMNAISSGEESKYTYSASGNVLTVTRNTDGSNSEVKTDLAISADFSVHGDTTQTVKIGSAMALNVAAGGTLNSLGTDGSQGSAATQAYMELSFGSENEFDADDEIVFGNTTITFGGTGGNDIDISSATTLDQKLDAIVSRMNSVATAPESSYTYTRSSSGVITITRDAAGYIATVGNDMTISTDFSNGDGTTQTVAIGKNYTNNGSVAGSVARSNGAISGSVSQNGIDGHPAASKATIDIQIANNTIDASDSMTFGSTVITFGGGGGNDVALGATLPETLVNIANRLNAITTVPESRFTYTTNGVDSIVVTRDAYGTSNTNMQISANFANGDNTNTVKIGSAA